jgi:signal transduction histidine kinase
VKTVLRNLISNALKFTPIGGKVTINYSLTESAEKGQMITIVVKDTGVGIPPEKQQFLFENPGQVKSLGTAFEKGTGLGLMLCKDFVEKNNGQISVLSEPGKGSSFIFTLPVATGQVS